MQDSDVTLATLHKLRTLGVRISMDDFGTGYSSLSYLRGFPFDKIKIDLSFVSQLLSRDGSMAVCSCSAGRGKSLGISTTAEGVETDEQLVLLRSEACPGIVPRAARRELLLFSQISRRTLNWFLVPRSSAVVTAGRSVPVYCWNIQGPSDFSSRELNPSMTHASHLDILEG